MCFQQQPWLFCYVIIDELLLAENTAHTPASMPSVLAITGIAHLKPLFSVVSVRLVCHRDQEAVSARDGKTRVHLICVVWAASVISRILCSELLCATCDPCRLNAETFQREMYLNFFYFFIFLKSSNCRNHTEAHSCHPRKKKQKQGSESH